MLQRLRKSFAQQQTVLKAVYGAKPPYRTKRSLSILPGLKTDCCAGRTAHFTEPGKHTLRLYGVRSGNMFIYPACRMQRTLYTAFYVRLSAEENGCFRIAFATGHSWTKQAPAADTPAYSGAAFSYRAAQGAFIRSISGADQPRSRSNFRGNVARPQRKAHAEEQGRP